MGRRTLLVPEDGPLDQGQFGDAVAHLAAMGQQASIGIQGLASAFGMQSRQGNQGSLQGYQGSTGLGLQGPQGVQGPIGWQGVSNPQDNIQVPEWLKPGVWAKSKDSYIEVISVHIEPVLWGPTVKFKFWRRGDSTQSLVLRKFLATFTQCEKPADPTSRYDRIMKGI